MSEIRSLSNISKNQKLLILWLSLKRSSNRERWQNLWKQQSNSKVYCRNIHNLRWKIWQGTWGKCKVSKIGNSNGIGKAASSGNQLISTLILLCLNVHWRSFRWCLTLRKMTSSKTMWPVIGRWVWGTIISSWRDTSKATIDTTKTKWRLWCREMKALGKYNSRCLSCQLRHSIG